MNGPKSWKDLINPINNDAGHEWKLTNTTGGTIKRTRDVSDFGGGFGRSDAGGDIEKTPKVNHYKCSKCNIAAKREFDNDRGILIEKESYRKMNCDELMIMDIIT